MRALLFLRVNKNVRFSIALCALCVWVAAVSAQTGDVQRALGHLESGRPAEAEALLLRLPESADSQFYLGVARFQMGRPAEAVALLERAARLTPGRAAVWKVLGLARSALGDFQAAEAPFRKACDLDPRNELACYNLGRNLQAQNRHDAAAAAFRKSLQYEREGNRWLVWRALALALEAQGDAAGAERAYGEALRGMPSGVRPADDPRIDWGRFLFRQGRLDEALKPLQGAAAAHDAFAPAQFEVARVLVQIGRFDTAASYLERAIAADPKHSAAHLLLGHVYSRLGRKPEAEKALQAGRALADR